jgi:lipopolysaccharide transport protein LptA
VKKDSDCQKSFKDLLANLNQIAKEVEPNPAFEAQLQAQLGQAHRPVLGGERPRQFPRSLLSRPIALAAYAGLAIATILSITTISSKWLPEWASSILSSTLDPQANAQTTAQLVETGQVIVRSDIQEFNEETQEVRAIGNATFMYSDAEIQAHADEIRYGPTEHQILLSGNVQIVQRGEHLRGIEAVYSIEQKQCRLNQE